MSSLVISNGEYGNPDWYGLQKTNFEHILCTDGAAAKAIEFGIVPDALVGDMDSIHSDALFFMEKKQVKLYSYPSEKDYTDTFLALKVAEENRWQNITVWGGTGGRLDHTIANLFGAISFVRRGMRLMFDAPDLTIFMIKDSIKLHGQEGDTVSLFPMGGRVTGVTLSGFKYPLKNAILEPELPIGISNVLLAKDNCISIESGILAIFHNRNRGT